MNHLYHHRLALIRSRFFLTTRTKCSIPYLSNETNESTAKVIYNVAPSFGHHIEPNGKDQTQWECNARVPLIPEAFEEAKLTPEFRGSEIVQLENFKSATVEDIATIHSRSYVHFIEKVTKQAKTSKEGFLNIEDPGPSYVTGTTFEDSLLAVGAGLSLVDYVVAASKVSENPPVGFALIRPPGHQVVQERAMGNCIFGNVAIAARYAQRVHGLKRVFIIDFDYCHGNGTNNAFYDDPDVFFLSTHHDGGYPWTTGKIDNIGCGNGEGTTLNLPLPKDTGDIAMRTVFDEVIVPSIQRFKPDIILVSAGYNGHLADPLGGFQLTTEAYYSLTSNIKQLAKDLCGGRCVFFLEGGYNFLYLPHCVTQSFRALIGDKSPIPKPDDHFALYIRDEPTSEVKQAIQKIKHLHSL